MAGLEGVGVSLRPLHPQPRRGDVVLKVEHPGLSRLELLTASDTQPLTVSSLLVFSCSVSDLPGSNPAAFTASSACSGVIGRSSAIELSFREELIHGQIQRLRQPARRR
jgi:hypothetical protein